MHKTAAVSIKTVKNSVNINIADLLICLSFYRNCVVIQRINYYRYAANGNFSIYKYIYIVFQHYIGFAYYGYK